MALAALRLPQNAEGEFFVDVSCIDCGTCRFVAPSVFSYSDEAGLSVVRRQPRTKAEERRAAMALVACPTSSIGSVTKIGLREASRAFPESVAGSVFYCGYAAESSFGASSWLIVRPEGNVLVDSPRAAGPLMDRIAALGGIRTMFLTHRDDVADHAPFARRFGCTRVLHEADVAPGTREVEQRVAGSDDVLLDHDLRLIPVPGHTRGSAALLYANTFLFTGDHLWGAEDGAKLEASRSVSWHSWAEQTRSMEKLLAYDFEWVLPGHGARWHARSPAAMRLEIGRLVAEMKREG